MKKISFSRLIHTPIGMWRFVINMVALTALILGSVLVPVIYPASLAYAASPPITVTTNYTLTSDITFSDTGFIIGADNITLDLNGHTVTGPFIPNAPQLPPYNGVSVEGRSGVTIKNGAIRGFVFGIRLVASSNNVVEGVTTTNNSFNGIVFDNSDNSQVKNSTSSNNGAFGVLLNNGSDGNLVQGNTVFSNTTHGIFIGGSPGSPPPAPSVNNLIKANTVYGNGVNGILVRNSDNNIVDGNTVTGNRNGIALQSGADNNQVKNNTVNNNSQRGINVVNNSPNEPPGLPPDNNTITCNKLSGNPLDINDATLGTRTAGTKNIYSHNIGSSSTPQGLVNVAPAVNAGPDAAIDEGAIFSVSGSFTDPWPGTWTAAVNYGDGSGVQPLALSAKTFSLSHPYADNGSYMVTVTITSNDGCSWSDTVVVTVNNVAPNVNAGPPVTNFSGQTHQLNASFTDPGIRDTHTAAIDWGDGSPVQTGVVAESGGSGTVAGSHVYFVPGTYNITVTVTDKDGGAGSGVQSKTVKPVPVQIDIKPGSFPNSINLKSKGNVPVGLLSGAYNGFNVDVAAVDRASLRFAGAPDLGIGKSPQDLDGDGDMDMVFHFDTELLQLTLQSASAALTGKTNSGIYFEGTDSVNIVQPK